MRQQIGEIYRREFGNVLSALVRKFGPGKIEELEAAAHDAFTKALETWGDSGAPAEPVGWLIVVAKNHYLNRLGRIQTSKSKEDAVRTQIEVLADGTEDVVYESEIMDNQLRMLFMCCHPGLADHLAIPLTLRVLCGLKTIELARAFLTTQAAMEKRLTRAKNSLRTINPSFDIPPVDSLKDRSMRVCKVLYLLFNEGYSAKGTVEPIRAEMCREAIRLAEVFLRTPHLPQKETHALLSLMYFQFSRLDARLDEQGDLIELRLQNRKLWKKDTIKLGFFHLDRSAGGPYGNAIHIEAMIASCHARATSFEETDWEKILTLYDLLYKVNPTPVVLLNRAVAVGYCHGAAEGLKALSLCAGDKSMVHFYPLHMAFGEFYSQLAMTSSARQAFNSAKTFAANDAERRLVAKKIARLQ